MGSAYGRSFEGMLSTPRREIRTRYDDLRVGTEVEDGGRMGDSGEPRRGHSAIKGRSLQDLFTVSLTACRASIST